MWLFNILKLKGAYMENELTAVRVLQNMPVKLILFAYLDG